MRWITLWVFAVALPFGSARAEVPNYTQAELGYS
jgi:hypothetical protein